MVSKRSQILFGLASQAEDTDCDGGSQVSSTAPSITTSELQLINDALTQGKVVQLGEEKASELCEKWVLSQVSNVNGSSPIAPQRKPKLVDYSPSINSTSSRFSAESRTSSNTLISARKRNIFKNVGHVFAEPAARLTPVTRYEQSVCKDLTNNLKSETNASHLNKTYDVSKDIGIENQEPHPSVTCVTTIESGAPKSSQRRIRTHSDTTSQLETPTSSEKSSQKNKMDVSTDFNVIDNQELHVPTIQSEPPKSNQRRIGAHPDSSSQKNKIDVSSDFCDLPSVTCLASKESESSKSSQGMVQTHLTLTSQLETPKSANRTCEKNKSDVFELVSKETYPRKRRSRQSRPPKRVASPDLFASAEEDNDLFSCDSDSSNQIESVSSSSSTSVSQKERNLELAEMNDDSDEERNLVPQKKIRSRKCSREEMLKNRHLRNSGQKYKNYKNVEVPERKRKPPHVCKRKCHETITDDVGEAIFHEYWEQGSYEKRVSYVASRVETCPVKKKRPRLPEGQENCHSKTVSNKYFFHIYGEQKQVCKQTFLGTLGETDGFLRFATRKKNKTVSGVNENDKRGKHSPAHKLDLKTIEEVKQHVLKFPSHKSHYKRAEVGDTRYLPSHLDRRQMHQMYLQEGHTPVSYSTYSRIFNTLGRSFKKPYTDTCEKCDTWKERIKHTPDSETKEELQQEWNAHLDRAKAAYDLKKKCKIQAESDESLRVLVFDLEQVLETPLVTTGAAFYLRQLSTYNLTIYDTTTKLTHCYMWSEIDGKRGANEIASCIFVHCLDQIPESVKKVILFSDSTTGQNKNSILSAMFLTLVQMHSSIKSVEHVFLEAGHTRLEVDSKHSVIERKKDHADKVNVPSDWYNLVRSLGGSNNADRHFRVVEMAGDFYDFQSILKGPLVRRTVTTTGDKFVWLATPLLRYDAEKPGKMFFKTNLENLGYGCLDFQRAGKAGAYSAQNLRSSLKTLYKSPLPVSANKKEDLLKLLPLLPPSCHEFYKSLKTTEDPESESDSESE